jgi:CHAT domain-containing protein
MFQNTSAKGDFAFKELENSISEVDSISRILEKSGFDVKPYTGVYGTEESFLDMHGKSPMILHVATHGFYYTPEEAMGIEYLKGYRDAMMLSGLIMSGGNAAWQGADMGNGTLGGVLTANDISKLDLSATELVVLSACKSGRGNVTPEGLYGLQRAFKKAGAGTLVMSLWNIKDKETAEFMNEFYKSLVNNNWNKHSAFEEARTIMRMRYPDKPYIWASFVMLD